MVKINNKKAISAVVATVLIVLITIAAISIIWVAIIPMLQEKASFQDELVDLRIDTASGYTVYDSSTGLMSVQVKRGSDNVNLPFLQLIFLCNDGNSFSVNTSAPTSNQAITYKISPSCEVSSVKVAPIMGGWGRQKIGEVTSEAEKIPSGMVTLRIGDVILGIDGNINVQCLDSPQCDDGNECSYDICQDNICNNSYKPETTSCGGIGEFCDGIGNCGVCSVNNPCDEKECQSVTCNAGVCEYNNLVEGTSCSFGTCDGLGACVFIGEIYGIWSGDYFDWTGANNPDWLYRWVRFTGTDCVINESICEEITFVIFPLSSCWRNYNCVGLDMFHPNGRALGLGLGITCVGDQFYIYATEQDCLSSLS